MPMWQRRWPRPVARSRLGTNVLRLVFDTNVVVSALVFSRRLAWLRLAWVSGVAVPVICRETAAELIRVIAYPKFRLDPAEQAALLTDYLPFAETARLPAALPSLPTACRDRTDMVFIQLAICAGVDALVSGDAELTELQLSIPVISAATLHGMLTRGEGGRE